MVSPFVIDELVAMMSKKPKKEMGTVVKRSTSDEEYTNPSVVKAVIDEAGRVLYFSRTPIPANRTREDYFYKHIGIYAYTKDFLFTFKKYPASRLERQERLEQLRALENGHRIWSIETNQETIGIDTQEDLDKARRVLAQKK